MAKALTVDICVIGAGSAGLTVAAGAAQMGASTALIERGKMGGDCLNYGCVPSKALLAAGHAAETIRHAAHLGIDTRSAHADGRRVHDHIHSAIAAIAPHDSIERFERLGVIVIKDHARFAGPREVEAGGLRIQARRFVVATGSSPLVPPIPGLNELPYLTNETIFDLQVVPEHLLVIGGGPIGIELAQAYRHLGSRVTVLEMASILPKDDPELVDVLRSRLKADGIDLREGAKVVAAGSASSGVALNVDENGQKSCVEGSHLLVATGRRPNVDGLDLDKAGVDHTPKGIRVDARLRTSNRKIYAIGDITGGLQFTHVAAYHASIVLKNALFRIPAKQDTRSIPWVTYTQPELAQVGLVEDRAREHHGAIRVLRWRFDDNDRAQVERLTEGLVKVITTRGGRILGAGIVGAVAGELIQTWIVAMSRKLKVGAVAAMIAPYPTFGEINKRAAGSFYTPSLFSERTRRIVRFLAKFG